MLERSFSHPSQHNGPPNFNGPPAPGGPPPPSSNASLQHPGFPGGPHPGIIPHPGGHPPPGSGYPNSGPPTHGYPQIRKRASHSNSGLPVLPPKKQHMDMPDEFKYQKGTLLSRNIKNSDAKISLLSCLYTTTTSYCKHVFCFIFLLFFCFLAYFMKQITIFFSIIVI